MKFYNSRKYTLSVHWSNLCNLLWWYDGKCFPYNIRAYRSCLHPFHLSPQFRLALANFWRKGNSLTSTKSTEVLSSFRDNIFELVDHDTMLVSIIWWIVYANTLRVQRQYDLRAYRQLKHQRNYIVDQHIWYMLRCRATYTRGLGIMIWTNELIKKCTFRKW